MAPGRTSGCENGVFRSLMRCLKSAQIPSRRQTILVNYTAQSIAALDTSAAPIWRRQPHRLRWYEGQGSMRPVAVVVINEDAKHLLEMVVASDEIQSRHSDRMVGTNRSATPLAGGVRNVVRRISIPSLRNTSSNPSVNVWCRSRMRNRIGSERSANVHVNWRACWITHGALGFGCPIR